jgi:hypothetical protein
VNRWKLGDRFTRIDGTVVGDVIDVDRRGRILVEGPGGGVCAWATCVNCGALKEDHGDQYKCLFEPTFFSGRL